MLLRYNREAYLELGRLINERQSSQLSTQLSVLQSAIVNFSVDHRETIRVNSEFRTKFTRLCQQVGIDPVALLIHSLGAGISDGVDKPQEYYTILLLRIVEVCQETRAMNGGLISLKELRSQLNTTSGTSVLELKVTDNDVTKCIEVLKELGNGYEIMQSNNSSWLRFSSITGGSSKDGGISVDQRNIYEMCLFTGGFVTYRLLHDNYGWDVTRCATIIEEMIMEGLLWLDTQGLKGEWQYWEPSWISN
ncbi:uncharacterized protein KQ657_001938 [Scheffersomyces spartinae]|uniref:Vacuolar-sorting protein SNF8 n=1 Tax=Scheffersomyces spartinae TaxID=45513 RepID=A0A9P8AGD3_9ASCO|nr:uncharacterized protein KQ657_001938 [Scheffersomyces spartinae]KAG7192220.1 hypothetical protein KQ657_001938 [Scheffersomyces spartinae]